MTLQEEGSTPPDPFTPRAASGSSATNAVAFRVIWLMLAMGWALLAALYVAYLTLGIANSPFDCPDPKNDSSSGTAQWSWAHMANKCTFTDTSWLAPGKSVSFYSESGWLGILGLTCVAVTMLVLGFTGFRATRRAKP